MEQLRSTTILAVKKGDRVAIAGDGQVTLGATVVKSGAKKIRRLYDGKILAGFAGAAADAFSLFDHFEKKLEEFQGNLKKSSVELAKMWRSDKILRKLEAMLIVADKKNIFIISGTGDVMEPDDGVAAIGSGGNYAYSAAKALIKHTDMAVEEIVKEGLEIAGDICIYTNKNIIVDIIE